MFKRHGRQLLTTKLYRMRIIIISIHRSIYMSRHEVYFFFLSGQYIVSEKIVINSTIELFEPKMYILLN